jgi:hypothetical protein
MNNPTYVTAKKIQKEYDAALRKWSQGGKIETIRAPGGKRLYKAEEIQKLFVMHESPVNTNEEILNDKSKTSRKRTLDMKSSPTLDPDSIGREKGLTPFWTEHSSEISKKLSLHTTIDYAVLDTNSLKTSLKNLMSNSWFTAETQHPKKTTQTNSLRTFSRLSPCLWQEITEKDRERTEREESEKPLKKKKKKKVKQTSSGESDQDQGVSNDGGEGDADEMDGNSSVDL